MSRFKLIILVILLPIIALGQAQTKKVINEQTQTWVSINTVTKFSEHWGIVADAHIRSNEVFHDNNFYFLRGGISYIPNPAVSITGGYAHMWLAPTKEGWDTYSDENRIYQQAQMTTKIGKVSVLQRLRNEQRWQEKIVNDESTGENRFTDRVRYLVSFNIPIFKKKTAPLLVLSDEILIHFGQEVVYNTFDQNRLFIGIKQSINPKLSFDFGYMNVYQQKYTGYQYDMNHTLRLFFYLNSSIKSNKPAPVHHTSGDE
ncbi:DUF2490 domain-containing protein [Flavobacterium limnophilum]|uniref:DUF2490 domain-containing protein n=1 Tax=Flavobacterium limnophilum TaxID=3003262 RepID=UPI002482E885|nr:DUF2490 domain-containing protein [Flavobacterium limnophilum]